QDYPYTGVLQAAFKMFYYNRCNAPKEAPYAAANWTDGDNFNHPGQDFQCRFIFAAGSASTEKDLSGGWFDAGDYNKYVTFTYDVLHNLLAAYTLNPDLFGDNWRIPESGNGFPDLLDEVKWELDWLLKMVNPDGSTHIKMGSRNHEDNSHSPPSINTDPRYYGPTCTSASATVASTFAHAALVFGNITGWEDYAGQLLTVAESAFAYVLPYANANALQTDCDDGSIVAGDADRNADDQIGNLLSAAVYLYELTGNDSYHQFLLGHAGSQAPLSNNFWGPYRMPLQDALLHYTTLPGAQEALRNSILTSATTTVMNNWNGFFGFDDAALYRDVMPEWSYHWGSNNVKASYGNLNLLMAQHGIYPDADELYLRAEELLHAFHGVNPMGIVYLSNMYEYGATYSVNELYHLWFNDQTPYDHALDSPLGPAPGYVVGGPNKDFSPNNPSPPAGQPPAKSFRDWNTGWPENSWEITEPAIYYQAAYLRLLTAIMGQRGFTDPATATQPEPRTIAEVHLWPNPATDQVFLQAPAGAYRILLSDSQGRVLLQSNQHQPTEPLSLRPLPAGAYHVRIIRQTDQHSWNQWLMKVGQ
ncbi:MAG: glycoside hydrolase family 9 protein, partial [Lewinella sp.]|nr:glycoside hydrolase family 9 protein [Lewinella sp.]